MPPTEGSRSIAGFDRQRISLASFQRWPGRRFAMAAIGVQSKIECSFVAMRRETRSFAQAHDAAEHAVSKLLQIASMIARLYRPGSGF